MAPHSATVGLLLLAVAACPALAFNPFNTTPSPSTPPSNQTCIQSVGRTIIYIPGGELHTHIDATARTCNSYYCDGGSGMPYPTNSKTCGSQCVDPDSAFSNICACVSCASGSSGQSDPCESNPCQNGGTCAGNTATNTFTCSCTAGFYGDTCNLNYCTDPSNPCQNGGTCTADAGRQSGYRCDCAPGYSDMNCQTPQCSNNPLPCVYGTCAMDASNPKGYKCTCTEGYWGDSCNIELVVPCGDSSTYCGYWAGVGECQNNPGWMLPNCQLSCGVCTAA
ncbi:adhesive plaque matrix protein 2-like isoform X1 [Littorina saxatilis]|uniref:adhesive plaque matrix protein 2-like isoform X1 n=1 Tax=Littorina saxatilis TaxID=31220 RepID=UPI0038B499AB